MNTSEGSGFAYAWRTRGPDARRALLLRASAVPSIPAERERRSLAVVELKAVPSNDAMGTFEGLAAVYGVRDAAGDIIEPGAFNATLRRRSTVPLLWQHNANEILGTAELADMPEGLRVRGVLNLAVDKAREAYALLKQRALDGLSIGFNTVLSHWKGNARHLDVIDLWEISLTPFPAQPLALVADVKSHHRQDVDGGDLIALLRAMRAEIHMMDTRRRTSA